jgi:hypothetical protein
MLPDDFIARIVGQFPITAFAVLTLALSLSFISCSGAKPTTDASVLVPVAGELDNYIVHVGKRVEITASYNYCWYPTVHRFPTGEILTSIRMSPDETNPEGEFSAYCLSKGWRANVEPPLYDGSRR